VTPHPPPAVAATHSPLSSSSQIQHVSSSIGLETSPYSSSSSLLITPSLSSGDSFAPGNPSRSRAPKTTNAPIAECKDLPYIPFSWGGNCRGHC